MSKGDRTKKDRNRVSVDGPWLAMPCEFLASRACAELSPLGMKMLVMVMGQLRAGGHGNGRIDAHPNTRKAAGWTSAASAQAALQELIDAGLVVRTRRGAKRRLALYGITLFPMHCTRDDLDVGAGAWSVKDWRSQPQAEDAPTVQNPAVWRRPLEAKKRDRTTRHGKEMTPYAPATGTQLTQKAPCIPVTGTHPEDSAESAIPLRDSPSREPSAGGGCRLSSFGLPIDRLLAARTRNGHDRHPRERCQVTAAAAEFAGFTPPPSVGIVGNGPRLPGQLGRWRMSRQGARVVAHPAATPDGPKAVDVRRPRVQAHALVWKLEGRDMRLRISRVVGLGTRLGAFALVVGLAACGGGNDPAPSAAEGMAAESAALGRMQALAAASTQQASTAVIANPTAADLFEWAQWKWPALFPAGPIQVEKELGGIHYAIRAYATGIFLAVGTSTGDVYALLPRPENPLVALGNLANFAAEISADSCTFRPGSCDPPGGLYLGYYAEDVADNPEDPTMGAFTMNLPSGEGAYAGSMFFTYVGCQTSNVGTVSGTKAGQAIGGTWTGTLDGLPQSGGYSAEYSESNDSYVGTYTVAAGKQFRNLLPCIQYYIASKGAIEMFPTGASDPATFAVSISGRTIEWSVVSGGVMALVYIIDPTVAETNGNPVLWQTLAAAPRLSMVISESITLQTGHEYLAVVSVANANNQRVAFGSQRFVAL